MKRLAVILITALALAACGGPAPEVPLGADGTADAVLVQGRAVYEAKCVQCHGAEGQGGRGKQLNEGRVVLIYPTQSSQVEFVAEGKGAMPAFGDTLTDEELEAVVRYTREVL